MAWYHNFTNIACAKKLRGLRQKLDALRVQTGQSLSKYQSFRQKLIYYQGISFFKTYLNSRIFVRSICTIQSHIINFQPFLVFISFFSCIFVRSWNCALQMMSKRIGNRWLRFECCILNAKKFWISNKFKKHWSYRVTHEFSSETLILWKRLSSLYTKCI